MSQGLVTRVPAKVVVPAKVSPSKQELVQHYDQYVIVEGLSADKFGKAAEALCQGDLIRAARLFNVQYDIAVNRTTIRHRLIAQAKKPQKAMDKAARSLVDAGLARTQEEALEKLRALKGS